MEVTLLPLSPATYRGSERTPSCHLYRTGPATVLGMGQPNQATYPLPGQFPCPYGEIFLPAPEPPLLSRRRFIPLGVFPLRVSIPPPWMLS